MPEREITNWESDFGLLASSGALTFDAPNIANFGINTQTFNITGVELGDFVMPSASVSLQGLVASAYVSSAGVVTLVLFNKTGADVNLGSCGWKFLVLRDKK